jgi:predicted metal-dependent phosphoesterase TrpH
MLFRADLHIHSQESFDSTSSPLEILKSATSKGINLIAVTDHGTLKGGTLARELAANDPDFDISVIIGAEFSTRAGDIIGLFLHEEIRSSDPFQVLAEIGRQGGISIYAHPFRLGPPDEEVFKAVDVVEIFNGRSNARENLLAQNLAFKYGKPGITGSDAHQVNEIARVYTCFELPDHLAPLSSENFLKTEITPVVEHP